MDPGDLSCRINPAAGHPSGHRIDLHAKCRGNTILGLDYQHIDHNSCNGRFHLAAKGRSSTSRIGGWIKYVFEFFLAAGFNISNFYSTIPVDELHLKCAGRRRGYSLGNIVDSVILSDIINQHWKLINYDGNT